MVTLAETGKYVGARVRRVEDPRLLAGRGTYVDDVALPGMLHLVVVRGQEAHAHLRRVDVAPALAAPGVVDALDGAAIERLTEPLAVYTRLPGQRLVDSHVVATHKVLHVGEPIAALVAESRYQAEDAAELVEVEYEPLPPVLSVEQALAADAPLLYDAWGDNVVAETTIGTGDVDAAFARAAHVFRETFRIQRHTGVALETRGTVASYDPLTQELTVWTSTQNPHGVRDAMAESLRLPEHRVRVIAAETGGGFGQKDQAYAEDVLACLFAIRLGRPVKWIEDRREHFLATAHGREQVHHVEAAVAADGTLLAVRDHLLADVGAHLHKVGLGPALICGFMLPGPYRLGAYRCRIQGVMTNKTPSAAYRGYGQPQAVFVMERLMDLIARALGRDPADLRRQNLLRPDELPRPSAANIPYDSGDYPEALERALAMVDYAGHRREQARLRQDGRHVGVGIAAYVQATGIGPSKRMGGAGSRGAGFESARVVMDRQGRVSVFTGVGPSGQGLRTTLAQLCADALGVDFDDVTIVTGDTQVCPFSPMGSAGSRSAVTGGASLLLAAGKVKEKLTRLAAYRLEAAPEDVELRDRQAVVRGAPARSIPLAQLADGLHLGHDLPPGMDPGLEAHAVYDPPAFTMANAVHAVAVEVLPTTGELRILRYAVVNDCGVMLNPTIVEGQIHGGIAQGLGGALLEELVYDEGGQLITTSLLDYLVPTAAEMPPIAIEHLESPSPFTPGGMKGMGEGGCIGALAAIANAVADTLGPQGARLTALPLRPERVLLLLAPDA
ncbi:MAG TPA: xanthine dehydrogenase family protein molybdopterin-binding subunit [Chloroflexota bacterium]|jgi:carbon-monoxide dehydrogenase large subunit